ncbi:hypothetical protein F2Q69_00022915 [Brassica cretica]|uniref:Flavanone 4-reductase n=1 Tax=Brassica cretica TaxID=69181 RepID=A0A8S9QGP1_BRACR|nr:hypothetical protein F2Q69_00022915 [Brassica cretica]
MVSHKETVCVTGASGFIGSWLVMRLLERGYFVRATVRDPMNGVLGIMKACAKANTVRRIVFTSSAGTTYFLSKTLAEKAAWNYAK